MPTAPDPADLAMAPDPLDLALAPNPADIAGAAAAEPIDSDLAEPAPLTKEQKLRLQQLRASEAELEPGLLERYGPTVAATLQSFAHAALPYVAGKVEQAAGVSPEQQLALREEHPVASALGTIGGIGAGVLSTSGIGAASAAQGAEMASLLAELGSSRAMRPIHAGLGGLFGPGFIKSWASPLAFAAHAGGAARAATEAALPVLGKTLAGKTAVGVAQALTEGAIISTALEMDEASLEGRRMHGDAILHGALASGGIGGVLTGLPASVGAFGQTQVGKQLAQKAGQMSAERLLERFGTTSLEIMQAEKWIGQERFLDRLNEAQRLKLAGPGISVGKSLDRAQNMLESSGKTIGKFAEEADARIAKSPNLAPKVDDVIESISDNVLAPLSANPEAKVTAKQISERLQDYRSVLGGGVTLDKLKTLRSQVSNAINDIYNSGGSRDVALARALRGVRNSLTEQIGQGLERTGLDPAVWRVPQRQYEVASQIEDLATDARLRELAREPQGIVGRVKSAVVPGIGAAAGFMHGGAMEAAAAAAGLKALGAGYGVVRDWAPGAIQRALESGAPKAMVEDMQRFADARRIAILNKAPGSGVMDKVEEVRVRYLNAYKALDAAEQAIQTNTSLSGPSFDAYRNLLSSAKDLMYKSYADGMTTARAGEVLETVDAALTPYSSLGVGREWMHKPAVQAVRAARDEARVALAMHDLWGAERQIKAIDRINSAAQTMIDPARVEALSALEEMTRRLQSQSRSKTDQLMGIAKRTAIQSAKTRDREIKRGARKLFDVVGRQPAEDEIDNLISSKEVP